MEVSELLVVETAEEQEHPELLELVLVVDQTDWTGWEQERAGWGQLAEKMTNKKSVLYTFNQQEDSIICVNQSEERIEYCQPIWRRYKIHY